MAKTTKYDTYGVIGFNDGGEKQNAGRFIDVFNDLQQAKIIQNTDYQNYEIREVTTRALFYVGRLNPDTMVIDWTSVID